MNERMPILDTNVRNSRPHLFKRLPRGLESLRGEGSMVQHTLGSWGAVVQQSAAE